MCSPETKPAARNPFLTGIVHCLPIQSRHPFGTASLGVRSRTNAGTSRTLNLWKEVTLIFMSTSHSGGLNKLYPGANSCPLLCWPELNHHNSCEKKIWPSAKMSRMVHNRCFHYFPASVGVGRSIFILYVYVAARTTRNGRWMGEWMKEGRKEERKEWADEQTNDWMNKWMIDWTNE